MTIPSAATLDDVASGQLRLTFDGEAVRGGSIDVADVAPALLALSSLIREANRVVNPSAPDVSLRVTATAEGSFVIDLLVQAEGFVSQAIDLLTGDTVTAVSTLMGLLGAGGLFPALLWLKGRKVDRVEELEPGTVVIVTEDGGRLHITPEVQQILENPVVRRQARQFAEPLHSEGIDQLRIERPDRGDRVELSESDVPSLEPADSTQLDTQTLSDVHLEVVTPVLTGEGRWRFSDGSEQFTASMEDASFATNVARNAERFGAGDRLVVDMTLTQSTGADGRLLTQRAVTRVHHHQTAPPPPEPLL